MTPVLPVIPVKHQDTPAWIVFVFLIVAGTVFAAATYVGLATFQNSQVNRRNTEAVRQVVDKLNIELKVTQDLVKATKAETDTIKSSAAYRDAFLTSICESIPSCTPPIKLAIENASK